MNRTVGWWNFYQCRSCDLNFSILQEQDSEELRDCPRCTQYNHLLKGQAFLEEELR